MPIDCSAVALAAWIARSSSAADWRNELVTPPEERGERLLGLDRAGIDLLHGRGEAVGGVEAARFQFGDDAFGAAGQQVLEAVDALVEAGGDLRGLRAQHVVKFGYLAGEGVADFGGAVRQRARDHADAFVKCVGHRADPLVERGDDLASAAGDGFRDLPLPGCSGRR